MDGAFPISYRKHKFKCRSSSNKQVDVGVIYDVVNGIN